MQFRANLGPCSSVGDGGFDCAEHGVAPCPPPPAHPALVPEGEICSCYESPLRTAVRASAGKRAWSGLRFAMGGGPSAAFGGSTCSSCCCGPWGPSRRRWVSVVQSHFSGPASVSDPRGLRRAAPSGQLNHRFPVLRPASTSITASTVSFPPNIFSNTTCSFPEVSARAHLGDPPEGS